MATANLTVPIIIDWKAIEEYLAQHDIVEVVRCKDCKHRDGSACDYSAVWVRKNGFCQWGERREDE